MYYKHLLNLIIQFKLLTFSLYIHCYWGKCSKCPLHFSQLVFKMGVGATFIRKSKLFWWMWLVQSVFERVDVIGLLNFHMWTGVKNFRPESGVKFCMHEIGVNFLSGMFNLVPHVKFLLCIRFWCESGMKRAWSYENILYGLSPSTTISKRCDNWLNNKFWTILRAKELKLNIASSVLEITCEKCK